MFRATRSFATATATNGASSSSNSYLAALVAKSIPSVEASKPLKKPTPVEKEDKRVSITMRERAKRRFDRLNLKPEFLPRWYLAQKEKERLDAEAAKTATKVPRETPAHKTNAKSHIVMKQLLQTGPITGGALFEQLKEHFVSRTAFNKVVRAMARHGVAQFKINKATVPNPQLTKEALAAAVANNVALAAAAASNTTVSSSSLSSAAAAAAPRRRRIEFLFQVRNLKQAQKYLGLEQKPASPASGQQ